MLVNVYSAKCVGIDAEPVTVEVEIAAGIGIHLVGLADAAVKESLLRTMTALQFLGFRIPGRKIVINLAPADVRKNGSGYDLPIAVGILAASGQCPSSRLGEYIIMGELGLDGSVRAVRGSLPIAEFAVNSGYSACILPAGSAGDAAPYFGDRVYAVSDLMQVIDLLSGEGRREELLVCNRQRDRGGLFSSATAVPAYPDFADIVGQGAAKRSVEIAAAGGHNVLLLGPPGSGKSLISKAMAGILPPMSAEESLLTSKIYSVAGIPLPAGAGNAVMRRPFRAPHHSVSVPALLGGGSDVVIPGEISLAHGGVLFIDEFCEAPKRVTESLRAPMEDGFVTISRLKSKVTFPSSFIFVAAANPCPCGYYGDGNKCTCSVSQRQNYMSKLSGPVMDRIDMQVFMRPVASADLMKRRKSEPSDSIAKRVVKAREIQRQRFRNDGIFTNSAMTEGMAERYCQLDEESSAFLGKSVDAFELSARSCSRIIRLSRTIADLEGCERIEVRHISEAVAYRFMDKSKNLF